MERMERLHYAALSGSFKTMDSLSTARYESPSAVCRFAPTCPMEICCKLDVPPPCSLIVTPPA